MLRIVIADDHDLLREGLRKILTTVDDLDVVGEASTGRQAVQLVAELQPDVVLMDISMPDMDGIQATEVIVQRFPDTHVVILTMLAEDEFAIHAIRAGAKGYLLKNTKSAELIRAVRLAAAGGSTIDPTLGPVLMREFQRLLNSTPAETPQQLSEREIQFLELLARGHNNKQIAAELDLAESTVKNNLSALFQKIDVRDRTQAVLYAFSNGLVTPPAEIGRAIRVHQSTN
jgi:DNA-binding NarL/FixJ family response regulator